MAIRKQNLNSSSLQSASYDTDSRVLTIVFNGGRPYTYDDVPEGVYDRLVTSASPGSFFHSNIKNVYG